MKVKLAAVGVLVLLSGTVAVWYAHQPVVRSIPTADLEPGTGSETQHAMEHDSRSSDTDLEAEVPESEIDEVFDEAIALLDEWAQAASMEENPEQEEKGTVEATTDGGATTRESMETSIPEELGTGNRSLVRQGTHPVHVR